MLSSLRLQNFRCFAQLSVDLDARGAIFTGDNAQGKTSILEAVCLVVRLHSPRTRNLRELAKFGCAGFGLAGTAWGQENQIRYQSGQGLSLKIDDEKIERQRDYLNSGGLIVWLANDDLELIRGSASPRRRYLDFIGTQLSTEYRRALAHYAHALKCRNRLLKAQYLDHKLLDAYEPLMAEHGATLIKFRRDLVEKLEPLTIQAQENLSGKHEALVIEYKSCDENALTELFFNGRGADHQRGQSRHGPHRDDLIIQLNQHPAAKFASEGQQRTLSIALKLAQGHLIEAETQKKPVYLIDDVFGELDTSRRQSLIQHLPSESQILITTTNLDWLPDNSTDLPLAHFKVENSVVTPY